MVLCQHFKCVWMLEHITKKWNKTKPTGNKVQLQNNRCSDCVYLDHTAYYTFLIMRAAQVSVLHCGATCKT